MEELDRQNAQNIEAIANLPKVDITAKGISERVNKEVTEEFMKSPTYKNFQGKGRIIYPLLLINTEVTTGTLEIIKERLEELKGGTEDILVMYRNEDKAVTLTYTRNVPDVEDIFLDYCITYIYFKEKGVREKINFDRNFNFQELSSSIRPDPNSYIDYKDTLKTPEPTLELRKRLDKANAFIDKVLGRTTLGEETDNEAKEQFYAEVGIIPRKDIIEEPVKEQVNEPLPTVPELPIQPITEPPTQPTIPTPVPTTVPTPTGKIKGFGE